MSQARQHELHASRGSAELSLRPCRNTSLCSTLIGVEYNLVTEGNCVSYPSASYTFPLYTERNSSISGLSICAGQPLFPVVLLSRQSLSRANFKAFCFSLLIQKRALHTWYSHLLLDVVHVLARSLCSVKYYVQPLYSEYAMEQCTGDWRTSTSTTTIHIYTFAHSLAIKFIWGSLRLTQLY